MLRWAPLSLLLACAPAVARPIAAPIPTVAMERPATLPTQSLEDLILGSDPTRELAAIEWLLAFEVAASAEHCAPPSEREIATARAGLADFFVVDFDGGTTIARPPSAAELDDLAYFLVGVAESEVRIGPAAADWRPPTDEESSSRFRGSSRSARAALSSRPRAELSVIEAREQAQVWFYEALEAGELRTARDAADEYLTSLGYPGPIPDMPEGWRMLRSSDLVMRDLALVSEILGDLEVASKLYLRADPSGWTCLGGPTDFVGEQLRGFIRTQERRGECRSTVVFRLLDRQDEYDPGTAAVAQIDYGPARLVRDGWDVERMYRGALLTRNRGGDLASLRRVLAGHEGAFDRLERRGAEDWEWTVRAAEGLADVGGREATDDLADLLPMFEPGWRGRLINAIGNSARRRWALPCVDGREGATDGRWRRPWERPVDAFATTCELQLDDAEAERLADRLLPYTRDPDERPAAVLAIAKLAVPGHRDMMERWHSAAQKAATRCERGATRSRRACKAVERELQVTREALAIWSSVHAITQGG